MKSCSSRARRPLGDSGSAAAARSSSASPISYSRASTCRFPASYAASEAGDPSAGAVTAAARRTAQSHLIVLPPTASRPAELVYLPGEWFVIPHSTKREDRVSEWQTERTNTNTPRGHPEDTKRY